DAGPSSLDLLLNSNIPLAYFLLFLLEEYSCENLFCYLEIEHFQLMTITSDSKSMDLSQDLVRTYLTSSRGFEVNLPQGIQDRCIRGVIEAVEQDKDVSVSAFDEVKLSARRLMADSYRRFFQNSRAWKLME
ncbi:MAG: RGS domain-containing protein, partial [Piptocephalis tieghemiana]